ncbi:MAG: hypothetical protein V1726_00580 [Methanobacteriota archaeon]
MEKKYMGRLIGQYCKIVTKEPGEERASVVTGVLEDVDYKDGFIIVDSNQGLGCLRINTIIAIKPARKKPLNYDDHAEIGIGVLIVFIASVLVSAIAASVLIQTAETLQQRAYSVGKQTIREVSSGMKIIDMTGYTNTNRSRIEFLAITVKCRAGSFDIDLQKTLLYLSSERLTVLTLATDSDLCMLGASADGIFETLNMSKLNSTKYGVIATHDGDQSVIISHGISTEDTVILMVNLSAAFPESNGVATGQRFSGRLVPELGSAGTFLCETPMVYEHRVVPL